MNREPARRYVSFMNSLASPATVVAPEQGQSYWIAGDHVTFKLTREHTNGAFVFAINESAPQSGPPPHVHAREDEIFFILEGEYDFLLDDKRFTAGPGAAVFLPRGVTHGFRNITDRRGKMIVIATPAGFDEFVPAAGDLCVDRNVSPGFGQPQVEKLLAACKFFGIEMRPEWKANKNITRPWPRELWCIGLHVRILLTGEQTSGAFSVVELGVRPGDFVPPHLHAREDEAFYVLEGSVEFELDGEKLNAGAGTLVHIPRQTYHGFRNTSSTRVRLFNLHTPGGFDKFFEASSTVCTDVAKGPPNTPVDFVRFAKICEAHGMTLAQ
jgi:mannose-6-phosphate isomerase-like protein (cupin superfamily)